MKNAPLPHVESPAPRKSRTLAVSANNGETAPRAATSSDHVNIDGEPYVAIWNVDQLAPFLVTLSSNANHWAFIGSNSPFTAGRLDPDHALFPYQTADKILRHADSSGAMSIFLVKTDEDETVTWEPWRDTGHAVKRNLYKHVHNHKIVFEETNFDLGLRFSWTLSTSEAYGLVRTSLLENISQAPVSLRYLDGYHQLLPPGVSAEMYARYSYLAAAYMRHEREDALGIYTLNSAISDRAEPCESLRAACAWSVGLAHPVILLSTRQVDAFRAGAPVHAESEIRGDFGAYLATGQLTLQAGKSTGWITVVDTCLDHSDVVQLRDQLRDPVALKASLHRDIAEGARNLEYRIAASDGLQQTADRTVTVHHFSNVLFNCMRGGTLPDSYYLPGADFAAFVRSRNTLIHARHADWLEKLPQRMTLDALRKSVRLQGDAQLTRLAAEYLPLTFSRRHGDPSRPWNRFAIRIKDEHDHFIYGYEGNWRDIFQNWESLAQSYPEALRSMIAIFLNASTADGYNPYRITRSGIDWELLHPEDPWSHIGYWGDHQIIYLLRLLESFERFYPGNLARELGRRMYAYALVPYEIKDFDDLVRDPRHSIDFNSALHRQLQKIAATIGNDGKLLSNDIGEVVLVTLAEKLLVPLLVKLSNLVPGGGIWLNTQRPEWNDGNNALAGYGLSMVTVNYLRRYILFMQGIFASAEKIEVSSCVAALLEEISRVLKKGTCHSDADRYRMVKALGEAGERHRKAVYSHDLGAPVPIPPSQIHDLLEQALRAVDNSIRANRCADGMYHSYNLLHFEGQAASVRHLQLMCEGQVAALSSGLLSPEEVLELVQGLRQSELYRPDQHSYLLQPDRPIPSFLTRNRLPADAASRAPLLASLVRAGDRRIVIADEAGDLHFQADLTNARDLLTQLDRLAANPVWAEAIARDRKALLALWEEVFHHSAFTGRSGTMFAFEGLGSIYWHMVAKLLLALQECHSHAVATGAGSATVEALREAYYDLRAGLGFSKTPDVYGAFPTDPYSHSPRHRGAQQPGMTGQVKEEILTRFGELGVSVSAGQLCFRPTLLRTREFISEPHTFDYFDLAGAEQHWPLPAGTLGFTYCQVPVCYLIGPAPCITLERANGEVTSVEGHLCPAAESSAIFRRSGEVSRIIVEIPHTALLA